MFLPKPDDRNAHKARRLPVAVAEFRSVFRRNRSLRWRTRVALRRLLPERFAAKAASRITAGIWSFLGSPWTPLLAAFVVAGLITADVQRAPLAVFFNEEAIDNLLGQLWQVEAAATALVLAASLFAFESLTRQRTNLPLVEYANRSGLGQFLMLAAAGLLVIPVVLVGGSGRSIPSAAFAALLVGISGLVALPFFFVRAMHVVHPTWLTDERMRDIRRTTEALVSRDAFERVALVELQKWAAATGAEVLFRPGGADRVVTEVSVRTGTVLDIDLDRLEAEARDHSGELLVMARLGRDTWENSPLIGKKDESGSVRGRKVVTVSTRKPDDRMNLLVADLFEEGIESVRRGSPGSAAQVALMYAEVWLAWPRAWGKFGQRLQGGLIGGLEPFRVHPTDDLKRNLAATVENAIDNGLRDHVAEFQGVLWKVGFGASRLGALDIVGEMLTLARWYLASESRLYPKAAARATERAGRFQLELCDFAGRHLHSAESDLDAARDGAEQVELCFDSLVESLHSLFKFGKFDEFVAVDRRFRGILQHWDPSSAEIMAKEILEDPDRFDADDAALERASGVLEMEEVRRRLDDLRSGGRLAVLGWILRSSDGSTMTGSEIDLVRGLAGTVGSVEDLVAAAGVALDQHQDRMSRWITFRQPTGEVRWIDSDGPILMAFALALMSKSDVDRVPPAAWINQHRVERFSGIVDEIAGRAELWGRMGETADDVRTRADVVRAIVSAAHVEQEANERIELARRDVDLTKVETFRASVIEGWRKGRALPEFAEQSGLDIESIPSEDWTGDRFGTAPLIRPKGLFVTPTDWVGVGRNGEDSGWSLARGEVASVVQLVTEYAVLATSPGAAHQRLSAVLDQLRAAGCQPSLVLLPLSWRVVELLGLDPAGRLNAHDALGRNLRGWFEQVPVVAWPDVPDNRIYGVDLARFCEVVDGVEPDGTPSPPSVSVEAIDELMAGEIISSWEPLDDHDAEEDQRLQLLSSVKVQILRPFAVRLLDANAALYIELPSAESA